jgi:haloalkane dehalogenase
MIEAGLSERKRRAAVLGRTMAYVDVGQGDPIVFLHGNPTSSYVWRNVIPHLEGLGRCIAPDLIGMGDSDKLSNSGPGSYTFVEHARYLEALLHTLGATERVTFVLHDWGSALGFAYAQRNEQAVKGMAYMEALVRPVNWLDFAPEFRSLLEALRSPAGDQMILDQNLFIEQVLPNGMLRSLSPEEMAEYRRPFVEAGESRRPTLTWPRQIPIEGQPPDVDAIVASYSQWLSRCSIPKLFVKGEPGATLSRGPLVDFCRGWRAQTEVTVPGVHFLQEDSPDQIGQAVATWLQSLD